jgi:RNase P subunit RPR2
VASKIDSATWETGEAVFLETTAAAERVFGLPETIEFIDGVCQDKTLLSSTYVWDEFRQTFLYDTIICHTVFVNSLERQEDFATALKRLPRFHELRYKPRKLRRALDVIARLHEMPFESLEEAIQRLENDIRYTLERFFFKGLQRPLLEGAGCRMTAESPIETVPPVSGSYSTFKLPSKCSKKERPECGIISFWKERWADLEAVANMKIPSDIKKNICTELEEFRKAGKTIEAYGTRCYAKMADTIICLECPPGASIVTSNQNHYRPLCQTLRRLDPICFQP